MTGNYVYTPSLWPSVFTVLLLVALAVFSWRRRKAPGALPFMFACLFATLWAAGIVLEVAAVELETKIFWFKFQSAFILPSATAITCFVLEYAWPGRWLTRRNLILLSIPCILTLGIILSADFHQLVWRGFLFDGRVIPVRGNGNWIVLLYGYGLAIINLIIFTWLFIRSPQHRWPVAIMFVGQIVGRVQYLFTTTQIVESDLLVNIPPIAFEYLIYAIALFGFRILDPIPLARLAAIDQMHEGVLVLDPEEQVVSLNPAAEQILGGSASHMKGQPVQKLLPAYPDSHHNNSRGNRVELSLGAGIDLRHYTLEISQLKDWRGLDVGRLLLLHDVTAQKEAQAHLLEQERALAILHEREQLARELHDSTGQVLGYVGFQLEVVSDCILDGQELLSTKKKADALNQLAKANNQLSRLRSIVETAHADMREYILNLRLAPSDQKPFFEALQYYLDGFSQNYDIPAELLVRPGIVAGKFDLETQMQLFRIIQEALSNARKHAGASCVQVVFEKRDHLARILIQDNGRGFDPTSIVNEAGGHFGLRFMQERAKQIGGDLKVASAPGKGTCIEVEVPLRIDSVERRTDDPKPG
jgi:PAS domain S-box-containing protein